MTIFLLCSSNTQEWHDTLVPASNQGNPASTTLKLVKVSPRFRVGTSWTREWTTTPVSASRPQHPSTPDRVTCISGVKALCISVCSTQTQQIAAFYLLNFKFAFHRHRAPYQSDQGSPPREIFKCTACILHFLLNAPVRTSALGGGSSCWLCMLCLR